MKITVNIVVESDDGKFKQESVSCVGVDTRLPGIDPDSAKEDFVAQARGILTAVGETHVPALYAAVQEAVDSAAKNPSGDSPGGDPEPADKKPSEAKEEVARRLEQIRELRKAAGDPVAEAAE